MEIKQSCELHSHETLLMNRIKLYFNKTAIK